MGLELAKAWVRVRGDNSELGGDLNAAKSQVIAAMQDIAAGAVAIMAPFAMFGKNIISQGLAAAGEFEKTTIEMETMLGSAEATQKTMADLTEFAVKTPFEMPGILRVATGLIQFGERGKELMETIKILGDASGGTAEKFQILGMVFNQVRGVGKLMTQDFRQLSTRGIISLEDIAKHFKTTTANAQEMLSNGKVTFKDFREIMKELTSEGGRFAGMMEKQSTSLIGLKSTFEDAKNIAIRMLATPLVPFMKKFLDLSIQAANALEKFVREGGQAVSFAFTGAVAFASLGAAILGVAWASKLLGISIRQAIIGTGVGILIIALGAAVGYLVSRLMEGVSVTKMFARAWKFVLAAIQPYIDLFDQFVKENSAKLRELQQLFFEIWDSIKLSAIEIFSGISSFISETLFGAALSFKDFAAASLEELRAILDWVSLMSQDWELTWDYMKISGLMYAFEFLDGMYNVLGAIGEYTTAAANGMIAAFQAVGTNIMEIFRKVISNLRILFQSLWAGVNAGMKGPAAFKKAFMDTYNKETDKELNKGGVWKNVGEEAKKAFDASFGPKTDSPFKAAAKDADAARQSVKKAMGALREKKRKEGTPFDLPQDFGPGGPKKDSVSEKKKEEAQNGLLLDAGRYQFVDVGRKIQDAMLKGDKDTGKQTVDLLKAGLDKQDELLKATKENKPGGLASP